MPKLSVVIPCYNAAAFLDDALRSVLTQSRVPDQVIVIDDGSQDDSARIAQSHGVSCIRQSNQGISAARNRGIDEACGDLIAFLDADDIWPRHSLAVRCEALERDPGIACVFGQTEQFAADASAPEPPRFGRLVGAMLARSSAFAQVGLFDLTLRIGETLDWMARFDDLGLRRTTVPQVVLRRRLHTTNTVRDLGKQADYLKALRASLQRRRAARSDS